MISTKADSEIITTPLIISGPSGAGKGTLISMLLKEHGGRFAQKISYTTRKPRKEDKDGVTYYFVTEEKFQQMKDNNEFVECVTYNKNLYGTAKSEMERIAKLGKICVIEVDVKGAKKIHDTGMKANYIFIKTKDMETLKKRLIGRGSEDEKVVKERIDIALAEIEEANKGTLYQRQIVNDILIDSFHTLEKHLIELYKTI